MRLAFRISVLFAFMIFIEYPFQSVSGTDGMSSSHEIIDASVILETFCSLEHKLNVMECVDDETDGQALLPWKYCLNVDRNLSKKELISLSCKSLYPTYKQVHDIVTTCVDNIMSSEEAAAWMPVLKFCALRISERAQSTRIYIKDNHESSSTNHEFFTTT